MSVQTVKDTRDRSTGPPPIIHRYPRDPNYRLSGHPVPQIGDIARCGHRKKNPPTPDTTGGPCTCVVCEDLARGLGL